MRKEREKKEKRTNGVSGAPSTLEKRNINRLFDSTRHRDCNTQNDYYSEDSLEKILLENSPLRVIQKADGHGQI